MPIIISGPINSGKSTALYQIAQHLSEQHIHIGGVINLPVIKRGQKIGTDTYCLLTRQSHPFARLQTLVPLPAQSGISIGEWFIFHDGIQFCIQQIERAQRNKVEIMFIDEVGPLELQEQGFRRILDKILLGHKKLSYQLILVVRDSLVEPVCCLYPNQEFTIFNQPYKMMELILQYLKSS
ncbi:MAG: hypothetical protein N3A72_06645 [bacterium]|nr:hypothetical protein [bacterium]